jgi:hypothetical protein
LGFVAGFFRTMSDNFSLSIARAECKKALIKSRITEVVASQAGDRIKPGVERSGTPGQRPKHKPEPA